METIRFVRSGLTVGRIAFGALLIQRVDLGTARAILRQAYEGGINFHDTARGYSDSEEKLDLHKLARTYNKDTMAPEQYKGDY
jgi:aryl-alcohol dehydrogenase-like predicted oxidoreductase